jgi:hypothetical protein
LYGESWGRVPIGPKPNLDRLEQAALTCVWDSSTPNLIVKVVEEGYAGSRRHLLRRQSKQPRIDLTYLVTATASTCTTFV